jgi:hypothetical protein
MSQTVRLMTDGSLGTVGQPTEVPLGTTANPLITAGVGGAPAVNTANSSAVALGGGAVFTGTAVDVSGYSNINVSVFTDQASATNGLSIQQSSDGTNWDVRDEYTVPLMSAGNGKTYAVQSAAKFLRVVYTNGATPNTAFRLQTMLKTGSDPSSSIRMSDARSNENDVQEVAAYDQVFNGTTWDRFADPSLVARLVSAAASVNSTLVKSTPGRVHFVGGYNAAAALRYLKLYNKATAPTVGTDTPFYGPIVLPATAAFAIPIPRLFFTLGIGYGITVNGADADATALTAADITGLNIAYS